MLKQATVVHANLTRYTQAKTVIPVRYMFVMGSYQCRLFCLGIMWFWLLLVSVTVLSVYVCFTNKLL